MPDLRRDPIVGRWVIISTERSGRPHDFAQMQPIRPISVALCPFCPGQERLTPKEIMIPDNASRRSPMRRYCRSSHNECAMPRPGIGTSRMRRDLRRSPHSFRRPIPKSR